MKQWEMTLEFNPKIKPFKSFWYWSVRYPANEEWDAIEIGCGRADTLSEALEEIDRTIDVDLNNDWA